MTPRACQEDYGREDVNEPGPCEGEHAPRQCHATRPAGSRACFKPVVFEHNLKDSPVPGLCQCALHRKLSASMDRASCPNHLDLAVATHAGFDSVSFVTFVLVGCKAAPLSPRLFQAYAVGTALSYAETRPETRVGPRADSCTLDFLFVYSGTKPSYFQMHFMCMKTQRPR